MSRPLLLVFLVLVIVFTSQFEWKQQFGEEIEPTPTVSLKDQYVSNRQDSVFRGSSNRKRIYKLLEYQIFDDQTQLKLTDRTANSAYMAVNCMSRHD
ncbi:hypothetical protein GQ457_08G017830 [Hibiscus cannabinus]